MSAEYEYELYCTMYTYATHIENHSYGYVWRTFKTCTTMHLYGSDTRL